MGCVESRKTRKAAKRSKQITEQLKREAVRKRGEIKALIFGTSSSGKEVFIQHLRRYTEAHREDIEMDDIATGQCAVDTQTKSILETRLTIYGRDFRLLEFAGEKSLSKTKWMHCLEDVNVIIFVANISHYDVTTAGNPEKNAMLESMDLFEEVCQINWFRETPVLLIFRDPKLFEEKLLKTSLSSCFSDYNGLDTFAEAAAFVLSRYEVLDLRNDTRLIQNIFLHDNDEDDLLSIIHIIICVCPVEEIQTDDASGFRQTGICDESLCEICVFMLWYCLYCCFVLTRSRRQRR
ncbi:guanine nucleotide-binding protein G(i) subunit alpha-like [Mercenaria mercenaria]|uniref:guanine nucleotide-binding protein G(i) subunit alpha-like n=1 Tax=Mercenaria mercenaria TaxID=6596 RepID=UPI00234E6CAA|nr:guanine nucleotide-binding protein G(i) subunit alpha-like [Mercenaria mercenaria]